MGCCFSSGLFQDFVHDSLEGFGLYPGLYTLQLLRRQAHFEFCTQSFYASQCIVRGGWMLKDVDNEFQRALVIRVFRPNHRQSCQGVECIRYITAFARQAQPCHERVLCVGSIAQRKRIVALMIEYPR